MKYVSVLIVSLSMIACSSIEKSIGLGVTIGGVTGGVIGNQQSGRGGDTQTERGAAIGAVLGGLLAYASHKQNGMKQMSEPAKVSSEPKAPSLTAPSVRRVWIPSRIEGERYIDGHYEYVIEKSSTWSR